MKKDKGRKSLAAVGAVVAAGLVPGIMTSTPASQPQGTEATAADVVAINGETLDFDELFAATRHTEPDSQAIAERNRREQARRDSIRRAEENKHALVYGPPPRLVYGPPPVEVRQQVDLAPIIATDKAKAVEFVLQELINICDDKIGATYSGIAITPDSQLIRDLGMDSLAVVEFVTLVEQRYSVVLPDDFLANPPTLRRLAEQIVKTAAKAKR